MSIRINSPIDNIASMPLWLVVHGGFDFDPTVLAVCASEKIAKERVEQHYKTDENEDYPWNGVWIVRAEPYPWNGVWIVRAEPNNWIDYEKTENTSQNIE